MINSRQTVDVTQIVGNKEVAFVITGFDQGGERRTRMELNEDDVKFLIDSLTFGAWDVMYSMVFKAGEHENESTEV
mgnify:CR=1 FL=1